MATVEQDVLYDDWKLAPLERPERLEWSAEAVAYFDSHPEGTTRAKEQWAVRRIGNAIHSAMDGAHLIHRGDVRVSDSPYDFSFPIVGDLEVAWEGRSARFESKGFLPRVAHRRFREYGADQGLDWPQRELYLNEMKLSGLPFYVCWAWDSGDGVQICGQRVDLLSWPPHNESVNRLRDRPGAKMAYWSLASMMDMAEIAGDLRSWNGAPFQIRMV